MVRYGSELNISRTKATQITPKQKQVNTTQTRTHSTPCRGHAQTVITQHTAMGTQTGDTPLASNETLTATVYDTIEQILGKQEGGGGKAEAIGDSRDGEGGLERSRVLEFKQKGREMESKLKRTHIKEYKEIK